MIFCQLRRSKGPREPCPIMFSLWPHEIEENCQSFKLCCCCCSTTDHTRRRYSYAYFLFFLPDFISVFSYVHTLCRLSSKLMCSLFSYKHMKNIDLADMYDLFESSPIIKSHWKKERTDQCQTQLPLLLTSFSELLIWWSGTTCSRLE